MRDVRANDTFFLGSDGLLVVHVVSESGDDSPQGARDKLEDWLNEDALWADSEVVASTRGAEMDDIGKLANATGGFSLSITDEEGPQRAANVYTSSMTNYNIRLASPAYEHTIRVLPIRWQGPDFVVGEDFEYDPERREISLETFRPVDRTQVWVSYVPQVARY